MTVRVSDIVDMINNRIVYKPDWSFQAEASYETVYGTFTWRQKETDPTNLSDDGTWGDRTLDLSDSFSIDCNDYTDEVEVCRTILERCIAFEIRMLYHEAREFFRVKPPMRWDAPFHPHHYISEGDDNAQHPRGMNGAVNLRNTAHRQLEATKAIPQNL